MAKSIVTKDKDKWTNCIYIIANPAYNLQELNIPKGEYIVKIGSSKCLPARYYSYKTYSPIAVNIHAYYYIDGYDCYQLDDDIKVDLDKYRVHATGGIEFYYSGILEHLEAYFGDRQIKFTKFVDISDFPDFTRITKKQLVKIIKQYQEENLNKDARITEMNTTN